jgi:LacI family transcriptional regulator
MMAIGAARAILEKGYRIPDDISLVGFDGLENSKYYYPSISTMEQPKHNLGAESAKLLFERIEDDEKGKIHIVLNTNFIERESVKDIKKS